MNLFPLWNSLRIAAISAVIVFFLGIFFAYWVRKCPRILKGILDVFFTLSLVLPPTVIGFFLIMIFGVRKPIGGFLYSLGIKLINDWKGGVLAAVIITFPLMYRTVRSSFESFDENLISAGKTLGLSNHYVFWHITIPNCKNGLIAGTVLAFARGLGEYGATSMFIGYNEYRTATISTTVAMTWDNAETQKIALFWAVFNIILSAIILITVNMFETIRRTK